MKFINSDSGKPHSISFEEKGLKSCKEIPNEEHENIQQVLHIMDKFCIGEAAYHELICCPGGEELPRSYLVKQWKDDINKGFYIERTPGIANGAAPNFEDELSCVIGKLVRLLISNLFRIQAPRGGGEVTVSAELLNTAVIGKSTLGASLVFGVKGEHLFWSGRLLE